MGKFLNFVSTKKYFVNLKIFFAKNLCKLSNNFELKKEFKIAI